MSAAATAAGYLYASGRLRGKSKEGEETQDALPARKRVRVAVLPGREFHSETPAEFDSETPAEPRPKRVPRIEYRVRRWRPNE